jgi:hypothetical protein
MIAHEFRQIPTSRKGHLRPEAVVPAPYELVGILLDLGAPSPDSWLFRDLLPQLERVVVGAEETFEDGYNDLSVRGNKQEAVVSLHLTEPPEQCTVPTPELIDLVVRWRNYLRALS